MPFVMGSLLSMGESQCGIIICLFFVLGFWVDFRIIHLLIISKMNHSNRKN